MRTPLCSLSSVSINVYSSPLSLIELYRRQRKLKKNFISAITAHNSFNIFINCMANVAWALQSACHSKDARIHSTMHSLPKLCLNFDKAAGVSTTSTME